MENTLSFSVLPWKYIKKNTTTEKYKKKKIKTRY